MVGVDLVKAKRCYRCLPSKEGGQTIIEVAMILTSLVFFTLLTVQMMMIWQAGLVARYAAFMSARSLQVWGANLIGASNTDMDGGSGKRFSPFLKTFEDIYTCGVAWVDVPKEDRRNSADTNGYNKFCGATGQRKYGFREGHTNLIVDGSFTKSPAVERYDTEKPEAAGLHKVHTPFFDDLNLQANRVLRYGALRIIYRVPLIFGLFPEAVANTRRATNRVISDGIANSVDVPLLLNPGLIVHADQTQL